MFTKLYVKGQILLNDLKNDERGVTAIEYAIVAVAISGAVALAFRGDGTDGSGMGAALTAALTTITENISGPAAAAAP